MSHFKSICWSFQETGLGTLGEVPGSGKGPNGKIQPKKESCGFFLGAKPLGPSPYFPARAKHLLEARSQKVRERVRKRAS